MKFVLSEYIKRAMALKETRELNYWFRLTRDSKIIEGPNLEYLINESTEMKKILTFIVKTS